jgi:hypothetical protein
MVPVITDCAFAIETSVGAARITAPIQPSIEARPGDLRRADRSIVPIADVMSILPPQVIRCAALLFRGGVCASLPNKTDQM